MILLTNNRIILSKAGEIPAGNTYPAQRDLATHGLVLAGAKQGQKKKKEHAFVPLQVNYFGLWNDL